MSKANNKPSKETTKYLLKRLVSNYVKKHFSKLFLAFLCMVIVASATAINAWMMQPVLDDIFLNKNLKMLMILPIAILLIAIFKGMAAYFQSILMNFIGFRIVADVQSEMLNSLLRSDLSFFDSTNSGTLVSRFLADVGSLTRGVHTVLTNIVKDILTVIFLVSVMFYHDWKLAVFAFIVFPISIFPIVRIGKRIRKISTQTQESFGDLSSKLSQLFMGIKTVKSFNMENYEKKNIGNTIEGIFFLHTKLTKLVQLLGHSWKHLAVLQLQVLYGLGVVKLLPEKQHQVLFSFITALIMAYQPVKSLAGLNATLQNAMAAAQRVFL